MSEGQGRENDGKEHHRSPNPNIFSSPQNVASQGTGHSIPDYMRPTTSAPTSSLRQTWDNSLKFQREQQRGRQPYTAPTMPSQPRFFSSLWRK